MAEPQRTLLLVEDEALVAMVEKRQLQAAGYEVVHVATGEQAVTECCAEGSSIDLVLMDIDLGEGIDGPEAARRILARRELPLVFLSSHTEKEVVEKTEEITSYGYIVKNSGEVVLLASVKMAFRLFDAKREVNQQRMRAEAGNEELRVTNEELQVSQSRLIGRERALAASERRFRSIVEGAPEPIFIQTEQTFAFLNPAALSMFGAESEAELLGRPVLERVHPNWRELGRERMRRLNDAQEAVRSPVEQKWLRLNGEEIWVETVGEPIEYEGRNGALVFVREVTERHRHREALRAWHELMEYVIHHDPNAIAVLDRDLHFRYVSKRFVEDYGVAGEEVIGRHHYDVFPEIPERWREVHRRALAGEVLSSELDSFPRPDGSTDYTRWECRPWYQADGEVGGIILYTEVITERRNALVAQQENELFLHHILDAVQDGISVLNPDLTIRHVNRAMEVWYQDAHPLIGKRCYEAYHHNLSEPCRDCPTLRSFRSGDVESLEVPGLPGSEVEWVEVYAYPMREAETGEITAVIEFVRDITARKRAERELQSRNVLLRSIIDGTSDLIFVKDHELRLIECNKAYAAVLGRAPEELRGKTEVEIGFPQEYIYGDPEQGLPGVAQHDRAALAGEEVRVPLERIAVGGEERLYNTLKYPLRQDDGRVFGVIGVARDVTADQHSRQALETALQENETLMRELQHRVKNNLNVVSGLLAMEIDRLPDEQSRQVFADAQLRIQAMSTIYDMLHRTSSATHLDLGEYLETVAHKVFRTYRSPSKPVELVTDIASVSSDTRKAVPIGLILNELITNALKYAYPNGSDANDNYRGGAAPGAPAAPAAPEAAATPGDAAAPGVPAAPEAAAPGAPGAATHGDAAAPSAPGGDQIITVELTRAGAKTVLAVADRGVGLPPEFSLERVESTGFTLVRTLAEQLGAELQVYGDDGTRVEVSFGA